MFSCFHVAHILHDGLLILQARRGPFDRPQGDDRSHGRWGEPNRGPTSVTQWAELFRDHVNDPISS